MRVSELGWRGRCAALLALMAVGISAREIDWLARLGSSSSFVETEEERVRRELAAQSDCFAEPNRAHRLLAVEPYLLQRGR